MKEGEILPYLEEVDMYIKACGQQSVVLLNSIFLIRQTSLYPIVNGFNKFLVGSTQDVCLQIDKAFTVVVSLACDWSPLLILEDLDRTATYSDSGGRCS